MSQNSSPIEKVYIVGVEQCNATGAVLRLAVRGHSVEAVFEAKDQECVAEYWSFRFAEQWLGNIG